MQYKLETPVHGTIGTQKYQCTIVWRNGKIIADEPVKTGGTDSGPDPYTLLLSSLTACSLVTMRMYIERKEWDIPEIGVNTNLFQETVDGKLTTTIDRDIIFISHVDEAQKLRLMEIVKHCPISAILENNIKVRTFLFREGETDKKIKYAGDEVTVVWKPEFCQHSQRCWRQLPGVFDYTKKKWINPNGASADKIVEQVKKCPSGALTILPDSEKKKD
ncbi:MAG TPA: (4Fe-4S)-binding protein [Bacteroidia bacterium]|jgi:putative redox protein|nr:(4Fe-4S)-binding protein [Bacteroidia bacterium]